MGLCLCKSSDDRSDASGRRDASRKRSRSGFGTSRSYTDRGSSNHPVPAPDFGINSLYRVMELLGEGGTGQTWLCQDLKTHRRVAIKFIPRPLAKVLVPMVSQEIQLQAQLSEGHIGLVRVESALLSKSHLGLVMEYVDGGTLTQYVTKRSANKGERGGLHLTEDEARYFFRQLITAVEYLHVSHVAHRDLKMCNVVLTQRRPPTLKLCDFGFAKGWDDSSMMNTRIGTPVYMSPQLIASKTEGKTYSATAADVWACGVMLFAMLLGRFPYDHEGHPDPNSSGAHFEVWTEQMKASNGNWQAVPRVAPHINLLSDECKDLLGKMLDTEEKRRITIPEIRKHIWFKTELPPYLNEAIQDFEERQARLAKVIEAATEAQIKRRNKAVHDLIVLAGQPYNAEMAKRVGSGAVSAIFEMGTECDGASVASTGNNVQSPTPKQSLAASPEKTTCSEGRTGDVGLGLNELMAADAPSSDERTPDMMKAEADIILVELAAVAKRTKSDGLVLMYPDGVEAGRNCACDSDSSDQVVESSSAGGRAVTTIISAVVGDGGAVTGGAVGVNSDGSGGLPTTRTYQNSISAVEEAAAVTRAAAVKAGGEIQGGGGNGVVPAVVSATAPVAVHVEQVVLESALPPQQRAPSGTTSADPATTTTKSPFSAPEAQQRLLQLQKRRSQ